MLWNCCGIKMLSINHDRFFTELIHDLNHKQTYFGNHDLNHTQIYFCNHDLNLKQIFTDLNHKQILNSMNHEPSLTEPDFRHFNMIFTQITQICKPDFRQIFKPDFRHLSMKCEPWTRFYTDLYTDFRFLPDFTS